MTVTTFAFTGAPQTYTVPAGVTSVIIECWGAASSDLAFKGGHSQGVLVTSPGTILNVYAGGTAGWNGGGAGNGGGSGGGGGSDVRVGGTALSNRVIVAGGAGGGASAAGGGSGGGSAGGAPGGLGGGPGGTQTTGYALGQGGPGTVSNTGGGGGGYWGGYGSPTGGFGGGGGSGYTGTLLTTSMTNGVRSGNGQVVITAVNTAPLAPTLDTPATNAYIFAGDANMFGWTPNDPNPGDYQTRADYRWKVGAGAWTTVLSAATTVAQYVVAAATLTAGTLVEWQVSTYDNAGLQSPWSASSFVNVIAALAAPTITSPVADSPQASTPVSLAWTTTTGSDAYQVARSSATGFTGTIYYDSGTVASTATNASIPLDPVAGRTDYLNVRFRYRGNWSPWASVGVVSQYGPPQVPLLVLTPNAEGAQVIVTITNPAASGGLAATTSNDLTRTSPDGSTVRIAKALAPNATYVDGLPGVGVNVYVVTAYAAGGGTAVSA